MTPTATLDRPPTAIASRSLISVQLGNLKALLTPEATMTADDELTPSQVAKEFNVSPATVRRWEKAGVLTPSRRLPGSRHRRYSRASVDKLRAELAAENATEDTAGPASAEERPARAGQ